MVMMPQFSEIQVAPANLEEVQKEEAASKNRHDAWMSGAYGKGVSIQVGADGGMQVETLGPVNLTSNEVFSSDAHPESILATARSNSGRPLLQHEVTDTTLVTVMGQTMEAATAAKLGLLHRGKDGEFTDPNFPDYHVGTPEEKAGPSEPQVNYQATLLGPAAAEYIADLKGRHGDSTVDAVIAKTLSHFMVDAQNGSRVVEEFSGLTGLDPNMAKQVLEKIATSVFDNACQLGARFMTENGRPTQPQQMFDFLKSCSPMVKANISLRLAHGDISAASELTARYRISNRS